jgi:hypothetical protein
MSGSWTEANVRSWRSPDLVFSLELIAERTSRTAGEGSLRTQRGLVTVLLELPLPTVRLGLWIRFLVFRTDTDGGNTMIQTEEKRRRMALAEGPPSP